MSNPQPSPPEQLPPIVRAVLELDAELAELQRQDRIDWRRAMYLAVFELPAA